MNTTRLSSSKSDEHGYEGMRTISFTSHLAEAAPSRTPDSDPAWREGRSRRHDKAPQPRAFVFAHGQPPRVTQEWKSEAAASRLEQAVDGRKAPRSTVNDLRRALEHDGRTRVILARKHSGSRAQADSNQGP